MKVLIMPVHCTVDIDDGFPGEIAIMSHKNVSMALTKYIKDITALSKKHDNKMMELVMFDCLTVVSQDAIESNVSNEKTVEKIQAAIEANEAVVVSIKESEVLQIDDEDESTECVQLHVNPTEVYWSFYAKHGEITYETSFVPTKILKVKK